MTESTSGTGSSGAASGAGPEGAGTSAPGAPPKGGMSTGAKVLFACLGLTVLGFIGLAVALTVGGFALKRGMESAIGTMEEQQEASEVLRQVEEENPFEPPEDGVVGEDRLERFLAVTGTAWEEIRPWAEDLRQISEAARRGDSGIGALRDLASGARAMGGLARSRVVLAETLQAHDMSLGEYVWTGIQLDRAVDALEGGRSTESVPPANLELVEGRTDELPRFDSGEAEDPGVVLAVAVLWGMTDLSTWQAMGLDTLTAR